MTDPLTAAPRPASWHGRSLEWRASVAFAAAACAWLSSPLGAAEPLKREMSVAGRILSVHSLDLDGDGLKDLLAFSVTGRDESAKRVGSIFLQGPSRSFRARPDLLWELDRSVIAVDPFPGEAARGDQAPLYSLSAEGVVRHSLGRERKSLSATRVVSADLQHLLPRWDVVLALDFARPWSGGSTEFLIPAIPWPRLYRPGAGDSADMVPLRLPPVSEYRWSRLGDSGEALRISYDFTPCASADQDGDGTGELVCFGDDTATVQELSRHPSQGAGSGAGAPPEAPPARSYPLNILSDEEAASQRVFRSGLTVSLSGNARTDLVVRVISANRGILDMDGRLLVFRGRPDGSFPRRPDQDLRIEDAIYQLAEVRDLDADGTTDLIVPTMDLGLFSFLRVLVTRRVSFSLESFTLGPGGAIDTGRKWKDPMTVRLSDDYDPPVVEYADVNGDKVSDLIVGTGAQEVCVYEGRRAAVSRRFSPTPRTCLRADPYAGSQIADVDGDGRDDLIIYPSSEKDGNKITVFFMPG